jgi:5'-3' exonuclease
MASLCAQVDSEESKFDWQDILQLPFLPQHALTAAAASAAPALTAAEASRNMHTQPRVISSTGATSVHVLDLVATVIGSDAVPESVSPCVTGASTWNAGGV